MRKYINILFMGNHPQSAADCYEFHQRLDKCFVDLSGLQQPFHRGETSKEMVERRRTQIEIENFVIDIAMALTGKRIDSCFWKKEES
jgi:hypothetical protein